MMHALLMLKPIQMTSYLIQNEVQSHYHSLPPWFHHRISLCPHSLWSSQSLCWHPSYFQNMPRPPLIIGFCSWCPCIWNAYFPRYVSAGFSHSLLWSLYSNVSLAVRLSTLYVPYSTLLIFRLLISVWYIIICLMLSTSPPQLCTVTHKC